MSDGDFEDYCIDRLVVDNGTWMCKAGWSGDTTARAYVPTIIGEKQGSECFGDAVKYGSGIDPTTVRCPMERGIVTSWDDMEDFWHHILERELRIRSDENITMLITEVPLNPKGNREKMIEVLIEKFNIQALSVYDPATLALISSGRVSGITLDIGHSVTHTSVVVDGMLGTHALDQCACLLYLNQTSNPAIIATGVFCERVSQARRPWWSGCKCLSLEDTRNMWAQLSTTCELLELEAMKHDIGVKYGMGGVSDESFKLPDGTVIQDSDVTNCHQVLFHPELLDLNLDGIDRLLFESISNCESDLKNTLCSNIILAGGPTMCKGLPGHISKCIDVDVKSKYGVAQVIKVIAPPERKKSVWLGGSIVASSDFLKSCVSRGDYFEHGPTIIHSMY